MKTSTKNLTEKKRSIPEWLLPDYSWLQYAFTLFIILVFLLMIASCSSKPANQLETETLKCDWNGILSEIKKSDSGLIDPVSKALAGHAAIMLNKNNLSFIMLNMVNADSTAKEKWLKWTTGFAERFSMSAIANYLLGDALMRTGNQQKGLEVLNKAISCDPDFALAYNARGQYYKLMGQTDNAMADFSQAVKKAPDVAEFYASRATTFFINRTPEGSYMDYSKALSINPDFALAINGKACAAFYSISDSSNAVSDFDSVTAGLRRAIARLDHPVIRENIRSVILEIENTIFPDQSESPQFKYSDFFDWGILSTLTMKNPADPFRMLLKRPLPDMINHDILMEMNKLLLINGLFNPVLKNNAVPDSVKRIILGVVKPYPEKQDADQISTQNRLVFEKLYKGLIADFRERKAGMHLDIKNFVQDSYKGFKNFVKDVPLPYQANLVRYSLGEVKKAFDLGHDIMKTNNDLRNLNTNSTYLSQLDRIKATNPAMYDRLKPDKQAGGAWADIRRKKVDDGKPYSLTCFYSLGYESN